MAKRHEVVPQYMLPLERTQIALAWTQAALNGLANKKEMSTRDIQAESRLQHAREQLVNAEYWLQD